MFVGIRVKAPANNYLSTTKFTAMLFVILGILWLAVIIFTIKAIFERDDMEQNSKLLWTILIVVAPFFGLVIYYVFGDNRKP